MSSKQKVDMLGASLVPRPCGRREMASKGLASLSAVWEERNS